MATRCSALPSCANLLNKTQYSRDRRLKAIQLRDVCLRLYTIVSRYMKVNTQVSSHFSDPTVCTLSDLSALM